MNEKDKLLQQIIFEVMFSNPQNRNYEEGLTAIELSRKYNAKIDKVKKSLSTLQEKGVVKSIGANPKFWLFDEFNFQRLGDDDPIHGLLWNGEVDFDNYFEY